MQEFDGHDAVRGLCQASDLIPQVFDVSDAWYRVRPKMVQDPETSMPAVQFQHPVAPGNGEGGWMVPPKEEQGRDNGKSDLKTFSLEEIAKHNKQVRALRYCQGEG